VKTLLGAKRILKKEGLNYYLQSFKEAELEIIMKKKDIPFIAMLLLIVLLNLKNFFNILSGFLYLEMIP
jgi:hypothetical protein